MEDTKKSRLSLYLAIAMVITMLMGPGPGLRLVNPDVDEVSVQFTFGGVPIIYVWGIFWFFIQVIIIVTAYFTVWKDGEHTLGA